MQAAVRTADRVILQYGASLGAVAGAVIEDVSDAVYAQILTALAQRTGDGTVTLSADHTSVLVHPPTQAYLDAQMAQAAAMAADTAFLLAHLQAFTAIKSTLTNNSSTTGNDLTNLQNLAATIQAGTQPTTAQLLQVIRLLVRYIVVKEVRA